MQKLAPLSLALLLAVGGCQMIKRSGPWDTVTNLQVPIPAGSDPSGVYAAELHRVLLREGVPHRVVSYGYVDSQRFDQPAGSRTAVIYEDHTSIGSPYWLMDDQLNRPLWLPAGDLERQLRFYIRGKSVVGITVKDYPANGSPALPEERLTEQPPPRPTFVPHRSRPPELRPTAPAPVVNPQPSRSKPTAKEWPVPRSPEKPRHEIAPEQKAVVQSTPSESPHSSTEVVFRKKHGTSFDPASAVDRRKMDKIKRRAHH